MIEFLAAEGIEGAVIAGTSLGGMAAQGAILAAPDLFSGLVLAGAIHTQTQERRKIPLQRALDALAGMPTMLDQTITRWFTPEALAADGPEVRRVRESLLAADPVVFSWCWLAMADLAYGERLREIAAPALLIRGMHDLAARTMPEMAALLPNGRLVELADTGHFAPMERPGRIARLIGNFIAEAIDGKSISRPS